MPWGSRPSSTSNGNGIGRLKKPREHRQTIAGSIAKYVGLSEIAEGAFSSAGANGPLLICFQLPNLTFLLSEKVRYRMVPFSEQTPSVYSETILLTECRDCRAEGDLIWDLIQCKPRLLRRAQSRWGFQRGEAAALPFGRTRGFKPRVRYNLILNKPPTG